MNTSLLSKNRDKDNGKDKDMTKTKSKAKAKIKIKIDIKIKIKLKIKVIPLKNSPLERFFSNFVNTLPIMRKYKRRSKKGVPDLL